MARYEIKKEKWAEVNGGTIVGPVLTVNLEGSRDPAVWIGLHCSKWDFEQLAAQLPQQQREMWVYRLHGAFWRYAIETLEIALAQDAIDLTRGQQLRELTRDELDLILARVRDKACSYQIRAGREWGCTATHGAGTQVTTKPACLGCPIPDDEYLCSALTAPRATVKLSAGHFGVSFEAFCDMGRNEVQVPQNCQADGWPCWHRIVESNATEIDRQADPRHVTEALDFLNATWRLAFNKPLLRLRNAEDIAALVQPCTSHAEFKSAVSALDDVLKQMVIEDDLLTEKDRAKEENKGDKTLNRLTACLSSRLPTESRGDALDAIKVLRRVNAVRRALQHSGAASELLPTLAALGIKQPIDWSTAWDQTRRATIGALAALRRSIDPLTA